MASYLVQRTQRFPNRNRNDNAADCALLTSSGNSEPLSHAFSSAMTSELYQSSMDPSFGTDLSQAEAVHRLQDLMKENHELKCSLKENTEMMNNMHSILLAIQHQCDQEQQETRNKFVQAKDLVLALKRELEIRKARIETLEKTNRGGSGRGSQTLSNDLQAAYSELEEYKANLTGLKNEQQLHTKQIENLRNKLDSTQKTISELKNDLMKKTAECDKLESQMSQVVQHSRKLAESNKNHIQEKQDLLRSNSELQMQLHNYRQSSSMSPDALANVMKESFVIADQKQLSSGVQETSGQTVSGKYSNAEKDADITRAHTAEKTLAGVLIQLQEERAKVSEISHKIQELTAELTSVQRELSDKTRVLNQSQAGNEVEVKQLQMTHCQREETLQRDVDNLQRQLKFSKEFQSPSPQHAQESNIKAQVISLLNEVQESNHRLEIANSSTQKLQKHCEILEQKCTQAQDELETQRQKDDELIDALRDTVSGLERALATQKGSNEEKKVTIEDYSRQLQSATKVNITLQYQLDEAKKHASLQSSGSTVMLSRAEKRQIDEKIDRLTAQLLGAEDSLVSQQGENQRLQQKLIVLRTEGENLPVHRSQTETFRKELEHEKNNSYRLQQEKEHLKEEIENLRLFNQQLRDQLYEASSSPQHRNYATLPGASRSPDPGKLYDQMRGRPYPGGGYDLADIPDPSRQGSTDADRQRMSSGSSSQSSAMDSNYECPKCRQKTLDIDSLLIHVEECVQDDRPTTSS